MRVGVLTTSYPRFAEDYAGRFVADLAAYLASVGDEVDVIAPTPALAEAPGVRIVPIGPRGARSWQFTAGGAPDALWGGGTIAARAGAWADVPSFVVRLAAATRAASRSWDALLSHWLVPAGVVAAGAARGLPHLAIAHGSDVHRLVRLPGRGILLRHLARPPSRLLLTSEALRAPLARAAWRADRRTRRWIEEASVQRMGISLPSGSASSSGAGGRRGGDPKPRILFLGRLVPAKGVELLLEALAGVERPFTLEIVGDGPLRSDLEGRASALHLDCRFLGTLVGARKAEALAAADLLVAPSVVLSDGRQDSAPLVLLEALAAGVPVISSRVGGAAELLDDGVTGWLVAPGDVGALRVAIADALGDDRRREAVGAAGRGVAARYSWHEVGRQIRSFLAELGT